jgi:type III secretory pathway component EscS
MSTVDLCLMVRVLVFYWFVIVGIVCELVQVVTECQPSIV